MTERGGDSRRFPDDYTTAELRAIATRVLATGDEYSRGLLREQLEAEEFDGRSLSLQGLLNKQPASSP
jgi:hypothetical protein